MAFEDARVGVGHAVRFECGVARLPSRGRHGGGINHAGHRRWHGCRAARHDRSDPFRLAAVAAVLYRAEMKVRRGLLTAALAASLIVGEGTAAVVSAPPASAGCLSTDSQNNYCDETGSP